MTTSADHPDSSTQTTIPPQRKRVVDVDRPFRDDPGAGPADLPQDLQQETAQRLSTLCAVGAGIWMVEAVMRNVMRPTSVPTAFPWPGDLIAGVMFALLAASFVQVRLRAMHDSCAMLKVGLGLLIVNSLAIAVLNEWVPTFPDTRELSWNTILILIYAIAVPTTPSKMFAACVVAASADPLAVGLANLRGLPEPTFVKGFLLYYPNYICAAIAVLPSIAQHRMGRKISNARQLGSYELVERLAHGGMGEVWRAEHRLLARPAAIKLVRRDMLGRVSDQEARDTLNRFEREAQTTAVLTSPHTIDLFDFGRTRDGAFYYVMELLIGRDLESLVRQFGALPADRVAYLLRQVCHSLAEAHARGLVHRDVKPANVYVCRMGLEYDFVKVLDFGLVRFSPPGMRSEILTTAESTSGTPAYMAPEVILGDSEIGPRADVYSIGCLAYWLLTGNLVFQASSSMEMLTHHVQSIPVAPSQRTELPISAEWDRFVLACLEKNPRRRPRDAEALSELLPRSGSEEPWSRTSARAWWQIHLPELTHPLVLAVPAGDGFRVRPAGSPKEGDEYSLAHDRDAGFPEWSMPRAR
jgi:eukaryotic-like serine/threonine-protein kinase